MLNLGSEHSSYGTKGTKLGEISSATSLVLPCTKLLVATPIVETIVVIECVDLRV